MGALVIDLSVCVCVCVRCACSGVWLSTLSHNDLLCVSDSCRALCCLAAPASTPLPLAAHQPPRP